jgi:electron transport complex protein RnfB
MSAITPEEIDALLPQTQCELCGYGGCMPYAEALAYENAPINLCPPGGVETLRSLAKLLNKDDSPYLADMEKSAKPRMLAVIRESECIGCTKCIQACPVDSILGSAKHMHSVITSECTGCELCVAPCPVDCIDMININNTTNDKLSLANNARQRHQARTKRLQSENEQQKLRLMEKSKIKRNNYIKEAIERAKSKKSQNPTHNT